MADHYELTRTCRRLRPALLAAGFTECAIRDLLGASSFGAVERGEPGPVLAAADGPDPLAVLTRLFVAHAAVDRADARRALAPVTVDEAISCGLLEPALGAEGDGEQVRAALSVRALDTSTRDDAGATGGSSRASEATGESSSVGTEWLVSDLDGRMCPRPDDREQVMGVGHASLSLLRATPTTAVGRALDLGTGCGVQAINVARFATEVVATDLNDRAVGFARASAALCATTLDVRQGPWFAPVEGERFDLLVANPPFVVGAGRVDHTYRDSDLDLDGASELVVRAAPDHLTPGGTAVLLASWIHRADHSWRARVASWIPADGVEAWVLQRDVADPALYVGTWLRDEGRDPRTGAGREKSDRWLRRFAEAGVTGVGFGFVYLRAIDGPSSVVCEDLAHHFEDPLGGEAPAHFARMAHLRELEADGADLGATRLRIADDVALERVFRPGGWDGGERGGWDEAVVRVTRMSGPRWSHDIDDLGARLLAGCTGALTLDDLVDLLEAVSDDGPLRPAALGLATDLYRHGFFELG